eukprot:SAG31_NODE_5565_length_2454_cov_1.963907_1_plen_269_part_00
MLLSCIHQIWFLVYMREVSSCGALATHGHIARDALGVSPKQHYLILSAKIRECAVDLASYLCSAAIVAPASCFANISLSRGPSPWLPMRAIRVLELGCGHGLPGIVTLLRGAHVDFLDYNIEVIKQLTIPNVMKNVCDNENVTGGMERVRFFAGDWNQLAAIAPAEGYDLILAADTLYNLHTCKEQARLLHEHLRQPCGIALVAAKRYYFGVGGGTDAFVSSLEESTYLETQKQQVMSKKKWDIEEALIFADGKSNARLIIKATTCAL